MSTNNLLDGPVEREIKVAGEKAVKVVFKKKEHARILLQNLADMQCRDGVLTDAILSTRGKDYKENCHSMLLAACSPTVKERFAARNVSGSKGPIVLEELTKKMLQGFREFIYKCEFTIDEETLHDLHNFAVQFGIDSLTAKCEELADQQGRITVTPDDHEDVLSELFNMFMEKELTTTLLEDDKGRVQFAVHGPLIAAASPELQEILLQAGSTSRGRQPIRLGVSSVVLGDFIGYIYSAKVTLQRENAVGLLRAACTYEIPALAKACCKWLISRLETYDVVGILCLVRELDSEITEDLEDFTKSYIIANFSRLSTEDEFGTLDLEDLKEIIQDDDLEIEEEKEVFSVVMKWVEHDEENRLRHLDELLSCVRLERTSMAFLNEVKQDPRIASSPPCLQVIEEARHWLADEVYSMSHSSSYDEGFQEIEGSVGGDSLHGLPEDEIPVGLHSLSSASHGGAAHQEYLRDNGLRDSETSESYPRGDGPHDGYPHNDRRDESYSRDSYLHGIPHSYPRYGDPRDDDHNGSVEVSHWLDSQSRNSYLHDGFLSRSYSRDSDDDRDDSLSRDSYSRDRSQRGYGLSSSDTQELVSYRPRRSRLRKDGQPDMRCKENRDVYLGGGVNKNGQLDMRCKENRELYLADGVNKDGAPDKRLRENRRKFTGLNEDGTLDMRLKVNRRRLKALNSVSKSNGPLNKDGSPDMRCKENRAALHRSYRSSSPCAVVSGTPSVGASSSWTTPTSSVYTSGPLEKNGTPDMRYTANKQRYGHSSAATSTAQGPLKKNGTPDMRYAANRRQSHNPPTPSSQARGPLKKDGTPDMRYTVNKQRYGQSSAATSTAQGPLKKNGTPDMRHAANRRQSQNPPTPPSQARGPLKKDGTPDMRFKANRR